MAPSPKKCADDDRVVKKEESKFWSLLQFFAIQFIGAVLVSLIYYQVKNSNLIDLSTIKNLFQSSSASNTGSQERIFTETELKQFTGENNSPVYLAILGVVYDVSKGKKHYGPGGGYNGFAGRDGSRAFVTGQFDDAGLIPSVSDLKAEDVFSIFEWQQFYEKDYKRVGLLNGHYYDSNGIPTIHLKEANEITKEAQKKKQQVQLLKQKFPPCNTRFTKDAGNTVWCTEHSGGINRDWVGFPRRRLNPSGTTYSCVCVPKHELNNPNFDFKEYEDCDPNSETCKVIS